MPTLKQMLTGLSGANYVEYGYGQVEPNHLSAQRTGQIYAQLPAAATINKLEQGQFVKYDYANGVVNFTGPGEWMLVYNETKLYRDHQMDCEFAMLKGNYNGRVYSPFGGAKDGSGPDTAWTKQSRYYNGVDAAGNSSITLGAEPAVYAKTADTTITSGKDYYTLSGTTYSKVESPDESDIADYYELVTAEKAGTTYKYDKVTAPADMYELYYNEDPFHIEGQYKEAMMPDGTTMVPRVFKTNVGDIYTTNTVKVTGAGTSGAVLGTELAVGNYLTPDTDGYLKVTNSTAAMTWQVVKVYTMPDHQRGVKIMRIA